MATEISAVGIRFCTKGTFEVYLGARVGVFKAHQSGLGTGSSTSKSVEARKRVTSAGTSEPRVARGCHGR